MDIPAEPAGMPRGLELLNHPGLNKGTAFTEAERERFGLHGILPPQVETLPEQAARAYEAYRRKDDDLERHIFLRQLQDANEVLFHRLLLDHIEEMVPIVYTPVVALACEQFSRIYRRPRGLFLSYPLRHRIADLLRNRRNRLVDVAVVTDGERILGIGDQGAGGMAIPVGKLALYTLVGGIRPDRTLPILLDVGTNNPALLNDPEYLGWRHERISGPEYFDFVDRFVTAMKQELPGCCLQWEDFAAPHAGPLLERYRDELLTFNDDIQGTAAVALGAMLAAAHVAGSRLRDQQIVMLGAGSAALGVAASLSAAMGNEGLPEPEARRRLWLVNSKGLLHDRRDDLNGEQRQYAQPWDRVAHWPTATSGVIALGDVIAALEATALIGLSTVPGSFTEATVREMARKTPRPIVFPLSNPTAKSEAAPQDLADWTEGRALVATGSPYPPVRVGGRAVAVAQCNNVYIFPAVGLGALASGARRINEAMMQAAARELARHSPALRDPAAALLPPLSRIRPVATEVAIAVGLAAQRSGQAPVIDEATLRAQVTAAQWTPDYRDLAP